MSTAYKVLLLDGIDPVSKAILEKRGIQADLISKIEKDELFKIIGNYDGVVVRSATKINADILAIATNLKVVGRAGVGVDNIDINAATEKGVLVMNTPDGNTISTAEHTCGLILSLVRNIPNAVESLKSGRWDRKKYLGSEVHGKTLGVIGLGKIGASVAVRMKVFGMRILGYDPYMTHERARELGIELCDLDVVLGESDIITVHTPLTEKTKGMVSKENAHKLKRGVKLVNCARGGIFAEEDLLDLINDGTVSELALDVYSVEPPEEHLNDLLRHPSVVCTPHLGASTEEAQEKVAVQIAHQIADALEQKDFKGSINGKSVALSMDAEVQPFLKLAEQLGCFIQQIAQHNVNELTVEYSGACNKHSEVLTDALLAGYLHQISEFPVNLINARYLSNQKGLKIRETLERESKIYSDLITITLPESCSFKKIAATTFGESDFRIVTIDSFPIEIQLKGDILLYKNIDKPGMLAAVSSTLANNEINIAALSLGRESIHSKAITAVVIDKKPDSEVLDSISRISGVESLKVISL